MNGKDYYLTKEGIKRLEEEYQRLKASRRAKIGSRDNAPEVLHSEELNPEFVHFRDDLNLMEVRIAELENIFKSVKPIKPIKGVVAVGAVITVTVDGQDDKLTIVEALEADPASGKISIESPVGKALLGSREGDEVLIPSPIETVYKIKKISHFTS